MADASQPTKPRDPYIAIMRAAAKGRGLLLTADECRALSMDDAIMTRAAVVEEEQANGR